MPKIAENIAVMSGYAPGEQPKRRDVVKLNTNENPYPPSPKVEEALNAFDSSMLRRYPDPMATALRERIAELHGTTPDHVFAGNGSDEVLALATRCFVRRGGAIGAFNPTYSLYPVLAQIRDVRYFEYPLGEDFGWRTPCFADGEEPELFFLTNPNAPTGIAYPVETVKEFAQSFDGTILIDEAYADFAESNCMALATADGNENIIVSRTLSKSFSLAGLRLGYCIGPVSLIEAMFKAKDSYNLDAVTQSLGLAALKDIDWMRGNAERIKRERMRLKGELEALGWECVPSQTNFLFGKPRGGGAAVILAELKERGIYIRHFNLPGISEWLRITVGTPQENDALLNALRNL